MQRWVAAMTMACATLSAQTPELLLDLSHSRVLQDAIRRLSLRTGWAISYEEPLWQQGTTNPLANERLVAAVLIPANANQRAQTEVVADLVAAYNRQNPTVKFVVESAGNMTLVKAAPPAGLMLDQIIEIPEAVRYPHEHGAAIAKAVSQQSGISMEFGSDAGVIGGIGGPVDGFDIRFIGRMADPRKGIWEIEQTHRTRWGSARTTARAALLSLLSHSRTTMPWNVTCFAEASARCWLRVMPVTVEIRDGVGCLHIKQIACDRGCTDWNVPPPPWPPCR